MASCPSRLHVADYPRLPCYPDGFGANRSVHGVACEPVFCVRNTWTVIHRHGTVPRRKGMGTMANHHTRQTPQLTGEQTSSSRRTAPRTASSRRATSPPRGRVSMPKRGTHTALGYHLPGYSMPPIRRDATHQEQSGASEVTRSAHFPWYTSVVVIRTTQKGRNRNDEANYFDAVCLQQFGPLNGKEQSSKTSALTSASPRSVKRT